MKIKLNLIFCVVLVTLMAIIISNQKKIDKRLSKATQASTPWDALQTLRNVEKSEHTFIFSLKQEYRQAPIDYNYTSIFSETRAQLLDFDNQPLNEIELPFNRVNLYSVQNGFEDQFNLRQLAWDNNWADGYYLLKIKNKKEENFFPIILNSKNSCDVLVIASTNTWNVYNDWYDNFYTQVLRTGRQSGLGAQHPYARLLLSKWVLAKIRREFNVQKFLKVNGYDFCVISNRQYDEGLKINDYRAIVIPGHSEYWSEAGKKRLADDIEKGASVVVLSGNNMFRDIVYYPRGIRISRVISDVSLTSQLLGTYYWFSESLSKNEQAPYQIIDSNHWVFAGSSSSTFGHQSIGALADGFQPYFYASAHEIDQLHEDKYGFKLIAKGKNKAVSHQAHLVIKELKSNFVINFSSMAVTSSLNVDSDLDTIINTLLRRALNPVDGAKHE